MRKDVLLESTSRRRQFHLLLGGSAGGIALFEGEGVAPTRDFATPPPDPFPLWKAFFLRRSCRQVVGHHWRRGQSPAKVPSFADFVELWLIVPGQKENVRGVYPLVGRRRWRRRRPIARPRIMAAGGRSGLAPVSAPNCFNMPPPIISGNKSPPSGS